MNTLNPNSSRMAILLIPVLVSTFRFATISPAQDADTDVLAARRAAIAAYTSGVANSQQAAPSRVEEAVKTNWQQEARLALSAEGRSVRSLGDLEYQEAKARYATHLARSVPDLRTAWKDIGDKDAPDAWRCMVVETVPALLADSTVTATGLVTELQPIIRNDPSLGVRSAAIITSEALIRQDQTGANPSSASDALVSSIVVSAAAILDASGKTAAPTLTPEESAALSVSFQTLLRLIRHASVDGQTYQERIVAWGAEYRRFDYDLCLNYVRLLKFGLGVEPLVDLYDHAKSVARSKSESSRVDFIRNTDMAPAQ